jgi:hypothetical protein
VLLCLSYYTIFFKNCRPSLIKENAESLVAGGGECEDLCSSACSVTRDLPLCGWALSLCVGGLFSSSLMDFFLRKRDFMLRLSAALMSIMALCLGGGWICEIARSHLPIPIRQQSGTAPAPPPGKLNLLTPTSTAWLDIYTVLYSKNRIFTPVLFSKYSHHIQLQCKMSIFDAYDQEYTALSRDISKGLGEYRGASNAGELECFDMF